MKSLCRLILVLLFSTLSIPGVLGQIVEAPKDSKENRSRGFKMLKETRRILKEEYYDKNLHGIDIDAKYEEAREKIKNLDENRDIFRVIAQFVLQFDDSHTRFYPPDRAYKVQYGISLQMIGNICYVIKVKKGSDAEAKGLKVGDVVTGIGRFNPTRQNLWMIEYELYELSPVGKLDLFILAENNTEKKVEIIPEFKSIKEQDEEAERREEKDYKPFRCHKMNAAIIACKLETFVVQKSDIDKMMEEVQGHQKLILDLRGNGGGYVFAVEYLAGHFFNRDVKLAEFVTRKKTKPSIAKTRGTKMYAGELIVLIDSESASGSEVFARLMQIEKRGFVIGDVSAGAVMTSISFWDAIVRGIPIFERYAVWGLKVTVADLIMSDGNRLEKTGVIPDKAIGPSGNALINGYDPILAYAVQTFGGELGQDEAGKLNFMIPKDEDDIEDVADSETEPGR